ncbi:MAG: hypothetical protein KDK36_11100 [Leptospiraceae bacterium]|nr:hypothetical protein [Leptospiraceae bacterium]
MNFNIFSIIIIYILLFNPIFSQSGYPDFYINDYYPIKKWKIQEEGLSEDSNPNPEIPKLEIEPEKKSPKWFSINPGVVFGSKTLRVNGFGNEALITEGQAASTDWMFDVKSRNFQFSEYFGVHLLFHNSSFLLDHQFVTRPSAPSSGEEGGSGGETKQSREDLGTRVSGRYSMLVPIFYFGKDDTDAARLGFGVGPSNVKLVGNADFQDSSFALMSLLSDTSNKVAYLNRITSYQLLRGAIDLNGGDPVYNYLLMNLSTGQNLEYLGYYLAYKNLLKIDPLFLAFNGGKTGTYNAIEALALSSLARGNFNINKQLAFSFMALLESPKIFNLFRFRLTFGGPVFKESSYTFRLNTFQLALFVPIDF